MQSSVLDCKNCSLWVYKQVLKERIFQMEKTHKCGGKKTRISSCPLLITLLCIRFMEGAPPWVSNHQPKSLRLSSNWLQCQHPPVSTGSCYSMATYDNEGVERFRRFKFSVDKMNSAFIMRKKFQKTCSCSYDLQMLK